jgi:hypothetical protein
MSTAWDLEERAEDAFVAYLKAKCSGDLSVYPGFSTEHLKFPCVSVHAGESDRIGGSGSFALPREIVVTIDIMTEAAEALDASGIVTQTARERNALARSSVMNALGVLDSATAPAGLSALCQPEDMPHGLAAELTAMLIPGVWIDSAIVGKVTRTVEKECFVSSIAVSVIAQPVAIGGEPT